MISMQACEIPQIIRIVAYYIDSILETFLARTIRHLRAKQTYYMNNAHVKDPLL